MARTLYASEIECRVGTLNEKGCSLLLYKDARVDMRLLDEVYGPMNWKREHMVVNGNLFCTISIWDADKREWVSKQDVGTESNTEKEKGQASDAFKRAAFNWGIGRELYTAPFVWISFQEKECTKTSSGRLTTYTKFSVKEIEYNEFREIVKLVVVDNKGNARYTFPQKTKKEVAESVPGVFSGEQLKKAISEMKACSSRNEINELWQKYETLRNNDEFRKATQEMCQMYQS